jgi:hypothetical protein
MSLNTSAFAWARVRYVVRAVRLGFSEEKKLPIAALSQQLPERLMLQERSWSASKRWKGSLVY